MGAVDTPTPSTAIERGAFAERVALLAIIVIAALMRLVDLGLRPLQPEEAELALRSWSLSRAESTGLAGNPLLVNAGAAVMFALGGDDGLARLLPALAGIVLIWLTWSLRPLLGRVGALATAFLLAISPTAVFLSREFNSAMFTVTLLLAAVVLALAYANQRHVWQVYALAVVVGLLLSAGPLTWMAIVILAGTVGLNSALSESGSGRQSALGIAATPLAPYFGFGPLTTMLPEPTALRRAVVVAGMVAVLSSTGLLTNLGGIETGFIDSIAAWWDGVTRPGDWPGWYYLLYLLTYEAPALVVGTLAAVVLIRRRHPLAMFLAVWAGESFVLTSLAGGRGPEGALLTILPLLLLAGALIDSFYQLVRQRQAQLQLAAYVVASTVVLGLSYIALSARFLPGSTIPAIVVMTPMVGTTLLVASAISLVGRSRTVLLSGTIAALLSVIIAVHANFNLNFTGRSLNPAELVATQTTSPDIRSLVTDVDHITQVLLIQDLDRSVVADEGHRALLAWYLKDLPDLQFVEDIEDIFDGPAVVIASASDGAIPAPSPAAKGETYQVTRRSASLPATWAQWWRWWALREPADPTQSSNVVVYVNPQVR